MKYYQCKFRRGSAETVGWIEERGATVGNQVELLTADGQFWDVIEVYPFSMEEEALRTKQKNDRNSLPSLVKS